jgi:hypothetical protein
MVGAARRREAQEALMKPTPTVVTVFLTAVVWVAVLRMLRRRRARPDADVAARTLRSDRLHNAGVICAAVGFTWFSVWLITDSEAANWLHAVSAPAALVFIALGGVVGGP